MQHLMSCVLAAVSVAGAVSAADLSIETVLPERTAFAVSVTGIDTVLNRLEATGVIDAAMSGTGEDLRESLLKGLPEVAQTVLRHTMRDKDPVELLRGVTFGGGIWPMDTPRGLVPIEWAAWADLGMLASPLATVIDEAFADMRSDGRVSTERIGDVDVDHYEGDARDSGAQSYWFVHQSPWVMVASSKAGMERMLAVRRGEPTDGTPLGETEAWMEASTMMGGTIGMRCVLMPEVLLDIVQMTPDGAMLGMVRPVLTTVLGRHETVAMRLDAGEDDVILELRGGTYMPDGVDGMLSLLENSDDRNLAVRQFMDTDTVVVGEYNIAFGNLTDLIDRLLSSSPLLFVGKEPFDEARPILEDFLSPLGEQVTHIVSVQHPISADSLRMLLVFEVTDRRRLEDAFSTYLSKGGFKVREFQGHQIWSMETPAILPGATAETLSLVAAGNWLLLGDDAAVESALRLLSGGATQPSWAKRMPRGLHLHGDTAAKGLVDLHGSMATMLEIEALQAGRIRTALQAEDPELWEELAGDFAEDDSTTLHQAKALASVLGVLLWSVERTETGFGFYGALTAPADEGGTR